MYAFMPVVLLKAGFIYMSPNPCEHVVSDCSTADHHPIPERPPALGAGVADSGGDGLL